MTGDVYFSDQRAMLPVTTTERSGEHLIAEVSEIRAEMFPDEGLQAIGAHAAHAWE